MAGNTSYPGALDTTTNLPIASALVSVELDGDGNSNKIHSNLHGVLSEAAVAIEAKMLQRVSPTRMFQCSRLALLMMISCGWLVRQSKVEAHRNY